MKNFPAGEKGETGKIAEVILIQPPFVQLNSPYPAPYYLKSFLENRGFAVRVRDHSTGLFERIFSAPGLEKIFAEAGEKWKRGDFRRPGAERSGPQIEQIIERFLTEKKLWLSSIEPLVDFLRGKNNEWGHFLALANGGVPGGPRFDAFIAQKDGEVTADEACLLASKILADLADFISAAADPFFSLIKYTPFPAAESTGFNDFAAVEKNLCGFIMENFYRPYLEEEWDSLKPETPFLLGVTIPFPGCLAPALVCAASAKKRFGADALTVCGGGYVNTELRFTNNRDFKKYFDHISLDRGYGFLVSLLTGKDGKNTDEIRAIDDEAAGTALPDYGGVDFSRYICPVDDINPMHRLWSGGRWLKAFLAHGCYWHSCAFCDVTLDYIKHYSPLDPERFFSHFRSQAEKTGIRGVHLVDEAAPPGSLIQLAILNRDAGLPLNFWGNIRFEKSFTTDTAAVLASGGLLGVSAGIEIASEAGLKRLGKGLTLADIVSSCAAFKESGILVHAYLIFGFWDEDEQELINSLETIRQFFEEGLLDSCFWHKFILTRHSRIYAEKQKGLHAALEVSGDDESPERFAMNDLSFKGESKSGKYSGPVERLVSLWMSGESGGPVNAAFPFKVKSPSVPPGLISNLLDKYARMRDIERSIVPGPQSFPGKEKAGRVLFLGTEPLQKDSRLYWRLSLSDCALKCAAPLAAEKTALLLKSASFGKGKDAAQFYLNLEDILGKTAAPAAWKTLRRFGLVTASL